MGVVYTGDAGFHCGHKGVIQGTQIGGIVLANCQPLPGGGGWAWYIQVISGTSNILMLRNLSRSHEPLKCLLFRLEMQKIPNKRTNRPSETCHIE